MRFKGITLENIPTPAIVETIDGEVFNYDGEFFTKEGAIIFASEFSLSKIQKVTDINKELRRKKKGFITKTILERIGMLEGIKIYSLGNDFINFSLVRAYKVVDGEEEYIVYV